MMKLTSSERRALIGPLLMGCVLGAFVGFASWGFDSEYRHLDHWRMGVNASLAFLASLGIVLVPLAVFPIVFQRLRQHRKSAADE